MPRRRVTRPPTLKLRVSQSTTMLVTLPLPTKSGAVRYRARLARVARLLCDRHVVARAGRQRSVEHERAVGIDRQIVAAVVAQDQIGALEIAHGAADREVGSAAAHDDVADIGAADRAAAVRHRARLARIGRLSSNRDVVRRAARQLGRET